MGKEWLVAGGYNEGAGRGILSYDWDHEKQILTLADSCSVCENPSFLALHPNGGIIYAANETDRSARITAHRFDRITGKISYLNSAETTGAGMCHVTVNQAGTMVYGGNYGSGSLVAFTIKADGSLGEETANIQHHGSSIHPRQDQSRIHQVILAPDERYLVAVDFGADALYSYPLNKAGRISGGAAQVCQLPAGEGPRHMVFDSTGTRAYVLTELGNKIFSYDYESGTGRFGESGCVTLLNERKQKEDDISAEILLWPGTDFICASVRGKNRINVYCVKAGQLSHHCDFSCGGESPRMAAFDRLGDYLAIANQHSGTILVFKMDKISGMPIATHEIDVAEVSYVLLISE